MASAEPEELGVWGPLWEAVPLLLALPVGVCDGVPPGVLLREELGQAEGLPLGLEVEVGLGLSAPVPLGVPVPLLLPVPVVVPLMLEVGL